RVERESQTQVFALTDEFCDHGPGFHPRRGRRRCCRLLRHFFLRLFGGSLDRRLRRRRRRSFGRRGGRRRGLDGGGFAGRRLRRRHGGNRGRDFHPGGGRILFRRSLVGIRRFVGIALRLGAVAGFFRGGRHDVDDVTVVLAEGAHVDLAGEGEAHRNGIRVELGFQRIDGRRRRRQGVGEIEFQRRVEYQRELVRSAIGRDADLVGQIEDVAGESRLLAHAYAYRRLLALLRDLQLLLRLLLRIARAPREFLDDFLRQAGQYAGPGVGQQIDEQALARRHGIDLHLARERDADAHAVRVAPRRADVIGGAGA